MFLDKFLEKIGDFFTGMFNSAKKTWAKLSPEVQNAMLHGSGIIDTINKMIGQAPAFIIDAIKSKFPDLPLDKLTSGLLKVATALNIAEGLNDSDLEETVKRIAAYLEQHKPTGKIWAAISSMAANVFAIFTAPGGTKYAAVTTLMEFVYQHFIKKDKADETNP